jgi:hypothetical protein
MKATKYIILLILTQSFLLAKDSKAAPLNIISQPKENTELLEKIKSTELINSQIKKDFIESTIIDNLPSELLGEITADQIRFSQETNFYEAIGNAEVFLPDRDAKLYADRITYDTEKKLIQAFGNIKVDQKTNEIYGEYASFDLGENSLEMESPRLFLSGIKLKARELKSKYIEKKNEKYTELHFKNGVVALDDPIVVYSHATQVSTLYSREIADYNRNRKIDWNDLSDKSSLRYSAKEIRIDNTKKINNLRINGARVWINKNLSVPSPFHITSTIGEGGQTKFKGPVIGNRERLGGFLLGPRFYKEIDKGIFSFVPVLQIGDGPEFGAGLISTFNTPNDTTAIKIGYGSLKNRFIGSFHQDVIKKYFQVNALYNQFKRDSIFGASQVGQLYETSSQFRLHLPFVDDRGIRVHAAAGWAKDNIELFNGQRREDLSEEREGVPAREEHSGFRTELEASLYTQPIWRYGNELYNISLRGRGQAAMRLYDTGDFNTIARFGPALQARLDNLAFEIDYLFAAIGGESPFLFDQFIDGNQSVIFDGDYIVNKWFSVGTVVTYNINRDKFVRNEIRAELGPQDFKIRLGYDLVRNQFDLGFNVLYGEPIKYDALNVKM